MFNDYTPNPLARSSATPLPHSTHRGMKAIVRRARLEHLAMELLRISNALRLPVPVEEIYQKPPYDLWHIDPHMPAPYLTFSNDPLQNRLETGRAIARLIGECQWATRLRLLGDSPLSAGEVEVFALAVLMPTALLAGLNERQRNPSSVSMLFQLPLIETTVRLAELGYLSPADKLPVSNKPTS